MMPGDLTIQKGRSSMAERETEILQPRKPIAIVRLDNLEHALELSQALLQGGITTIEFTLTNRQALSIIETVRQKFASDLIVGAGTVLDRNDALASIHSGAQFLVTPAFLPEVIDAGRSNNIPVVCGAFTPTEILAAWRAGATLVKVFPAGQLGPGYIKDVLAPLPDIRLVPTGGVNLDTCAAFLAAGAYTVAIGSQLVSKELVYKQDWKAVTDLALHYVQACA
jgi:2-dehydro-3-deoxyphosphogluconate aldolase / (4S)-4-hydroxy-2-oxoglutarate aldolase